MKTFGCVSGLQLNLEKCEGFWLGEKVRSKNERLFGIKWVDQFKCLGVFLGDETHDIYHKNFDSKINEIEVQFKKWARRDLTFWGKVHIIKTHALSKLVLPISMLGMPNEYIKKVESLFYKFLWGKRTEKIKRRKLICSVSEGGLNMTDINSFVTSSLAYWIVRLNNANPITDAWAQLPCLYFKDLKEIDSNLLFNFDNSSKFSFTETLPSFYSNVFKSYNQAFTTNKNIFEQSIMNQTLWGNKFITFNVGKKKNVLFLRNWIRSGIRL